MDAAKSRLSHGRLEFASMWVLQCRTFVFWIVLVQKEDRKGKSRRKSCLALVQFHNGRKCIYQRDVPKRLEYIWEKASMQSLVHSCCDEIPEKAKKILPTHFLGHFGPAFKVDPISHFILFCELFTVLL